MMGRSSGISLALSSTGGAAASPPGTEAGEAPEDWVGRVTEESPVVIFSRRGCYMCGVMKSLFSAVGVHPTVIELEEMELNQVASLDSSSSSSSPPFAFIGGSPVGGLENLVSLHLSGRLLPLLIHVGALNH